jgi:hypothetical protein
MLATVMEHGQAVLDALVLVDAPLAGDRIRCSADNSRGIQRHAFDSAA